MLTLTRRRLIAGSVATALLLEHSYGEAAQTQSPIVKTLPPVDPWTLVDPELVPDLKKITSPAQGPAPTPPRDSPAVMFPGMVPLPPPAPQATERRIPGPAGAPELRIVIIKPTDGGRNHPALLHTHGGGFIGGTAQSTRVLQRIAETCSCVVVSVDYRLAPAARFPASLEDNYAALRWLYLNAEELGVDPRKIAVGGESAGGGHAAMLAIAARDRGEIPLIYQWLIYPMLDDRTGSSRAVPAHIGSFVWTSTLNKLGWTSLLGIPAGSASAPAGAVPGRLENLAGLPPTFIGVGSLDLFVQEDIEYAARLIAAGVPAELYVASGGYHGFDIVSPEADISRRFTQSSLSALRKALV